jgi:hypothetical protein
MKTQSFFALALVPLALLACGQGDNTDDKTGEVMEDPSGTPSAPVPTGTVAPVVPGAAVSNMIIANPANNYTFASTLSINVVPVQPSSELSFEWGSITRDFIGHEMNAVTDIDMVTLLMWKLDKAELERKLNADELAQSDLVALAMIYTADPSVTSGTLFEMTSFGMPIEQDVLLGYLNIEDYDPALHTYTIMAVTGTTAGEGTRMIQGFQLDPTSTNTQVSMTSDSTGLDYTVDIDGAAPTPVPAATPGITIDWDDMTVTSLGTEFFPNNITEALVAKYPMTVAELEANFLDLELIAEQMYRGEVTSGTSFDLSMTTDAAGNAFPGADATGTWVVALFCGGCANPAPWYLSVLQPQ